MSSSSWRTVLAFVAGAVVVTGLAFCTRDDAPPEASTPGIDVAYYPTLAYDPIREKVILQGGYDGSGNYTNETWEFDGIKWWWYNLAPCPYVAGSAAMAYDRSRDVMVYFGGKNTSPTLPQQTWEYRFPP